MIDERRHFIQGQADDVMPVCNDLLRAPGGLAELLRSRDAFALAFHQPNHVRLQPVKTRAIGQDAMIHLAQEACRFAALQCYVA